MTKRTTLSARLDEAIVRKLDRTARAESRTRTGQLDHILRGYLSRADSAPNTSPRSNSRMTDPTPSNPKAGTVPDAHLAKHGSVPEPTYRKPTGEAEVIDGTLPHLGPTPAREF